MDAPHTIAAATAQPIVFFCNGVFEPLIVGEGYTILMVYFAALFGHFTAEETCATGSSECPRPYS